MTIWKDDIKNRKKNLSGLLSNPSTRPIVFMMSGLLVGMLVVGYMVMGRAKSDAVPAAAKVTRTGENVQADPSRGGSSAQADLQREANARNAAAAQANNQSNIPTLEPANGSQDPLQLPTLPQQTDNTNNNNPTPVMPQVEMPVAPQPEQTPPPAAAVAQVQEQPKREVNAAVNDQIQGYLNLWGPRANQYQEFEYARSAREQMQQQGAAVPTPTNRETNNTAQAPASTIKFVRSGSVVPARLLTPVNSDNPGPVLAEITSGPLSGARMIGTMVVQREGVLLQFSQIMKPGWPANYPISAVGLSDDGYTGMATDVNHHYLQRYTALFAGTFMQGYGKGLGQQGRKTVITEGGAVVSDTSELNARQVRNQGYGEVAQALGQEIESKSDRDTTIEIKGKDGSPFRFQVLFIKGF